MLLFYLCPLTPIHYCPYTENAHDLHTTHLCARWNAGVVVGNKAANARRRHLLAGDVLEQRSVHGHDKAALPFLS